MDQGCWFWTMHVGHGPGLLVLDSGTLVLDHGRWSWTNDFGHGPVLLVKD